MEKKKNKQANLEKSKSMFLTIGMIAAFSLLALAFNWQSEYVAETWGDPPDDPITIDPPIITPDPPEPQADEHKAKKMITDLIDIVINDTPIDTTEIVITDPDDMDEIEEIPEPVEIIYTYVGRMPKFPGGNIALRIYVANHVIYPAVARENGIQGTVHMRFEVTKTGSVGRIEVLNKTVDKLLQDAAVDVIKTLPNFKTGMQNGEKVNVWFSIPISFELN